MSPSRAPRLCPRCHNTYTGTRCEECTKRRRVREDQYRNLYHADPLWLSLRVEYLLDHPYCECEPCSGLPDYLRDVAQDVDHRDGLGLSGPEGYNVENLQALSHRHHSRKTALYDGGFGRRRRKNDGL